MGTGAEPLTYASIKLGKQMAASSKSIVLYRHRTNQVYPLYLQQLSNEEMGRDSDEVW